MHQLKRRDGLKRCFASDKHLRKYHFSIMSPLVLKQLLGTPQAEQNPCSVCMVSHHSLVFHKCGILICQNWLISRSFHIFHALSIFDPEFHHQVSYEKFMDLQSKPSLGYKNLWKRWHSQRFFLHCHVAFAPYLWHYGLPGRPTP